MGRKSDQQPQPDKPPGFIRVDEVYSIRELCARLRLSEFTLRELLRQGRLRSAMVRGERMIRGADFDDFCREEGERQRRERDAARREGDEP